jgi:hypothetical protein
MEPNAPRSRSGRVWKHRCPKCGDKLIRVRRDFVDRLHSLFAPVRRFRCRGIECGLECTLPKTHSVPDGRPGSPVHCRSAIRFRVACRSAVHSAARRNRARYVRAHTDGRLQHFYCVASSARFRVPGVRRTFSRTSCNASERSPPPHGSRIDAASRLLVGKSRFAQRARRAYRPSLPDVRQRRARQDKAAPGRCPDEPVRARVPCPVLQLPLSIRRQPADVSVLYNGDRRITPAACVGSGAAAVAAPKWQCSCKQLQE